MGKQKRKLNKPTNDIVITIDFIVLFNKNVIIPSKNCHPNFSKKPVDVGNIFSRCNMIQYHIRSLFSRPNLNITQKAKGNFTAKHIWTGGLIHIDCVYSNPSRTLTNELSTNIGIKKS